MTSESRFHVVLTGDTLSAAEPDQVAAALARLFKMPGGKARALLGGKPVVVKKNADEATARKFQVALRQAGARCELQPVSAPATPRPEQASPSPPHAAVRPETNLEAFGERQMVGTVRTGGTGFSGPFQVAPVDSNLDTSVRPIVAPPDVSHLSLAEPGANLETLCNSEAPVIPNTSHLSLSEE